MVLLVIHSDNQADDAYFDTVSGVYYIITQCQLFTCEPIEPGKFKLLAELSYVGNTFGKRQMLDYLGHD